MSYYSSVLSLILAFIAVAREEAKARHRGEGPEKMREMMRTRREDLDCEDELTWLFNERSKLDDMSQDATSWPIMEFEHTDADAERELQWLVTLENFSSPQP